MRFVTVAYASPLYEQCLQLRREVLRWPLGQDISPEDVAAEAEDLFMAGLDATGTPLTTLALTHTDAQTVRVRQVAVNPGHQGSGMGRALMHAAERLAAVRGYSLLVLHARQVVIPFYLRLGYASYDPPFVEIGIPHQKMGICLPPCEW